MEKWPELHSGFLKTMLFFFLSSLFSFVFLATTSDFFPISLAISFIYFFLLFVCVCVFLHFHF